MARFTLLSLTVLITACGPQNPPAAPAGGGEETGEETAPEESGEETEPVERGAPDESGAPDEPGDTGGTAGNDMAQAFVDAHNSRRARHCANPLTWSDKLAKAAQAWADELQKQSCAFEHSRTKYGENLAGGTAGALDAEATVEMWYREVDQYNFKKGGFSMETGHFTQVVWKNTTQVGCGVVTCGGMDIIVCNYEPAGNYEGQYKSNVVPEGC